MRLPFPFQVAALLALACCSACWSTPNGPTKAQRVLLHKENALRYYHMREFARAQDQVQRAIEIDDDPSLQLILGMTLQRRGSYRDVQRAEKIFRALKKEDFRVTLGLGEALERQGRYYDDAARKVLSGERFADEGNVEGQGKELTERAKASWEEALEWFQATLELRENQLDALNGMQRTTASLGRMEASIEWSNKLLEEVTLNIEFYDRQLQRPDITAADERNWRDHLDTNTDIEVMTRLHAASLLHILGRKEEGKAHLDRVIELEPDRPGPYSRRAQILMEMGEYEQAINSLDRFLALSPHPFEHPDVRKAYHLRSECEIALSVKEPTLETSGN